MHHRGCFLPPSLLSPPPPGPQGLYMPGKHSTTETNPSSQALMLIFFFKVKSYVRNQVYNLYAYFPVTSATEYS